MRSDTPLLALTFTAEADLLGAVHRAREEGMTIVDALTPYAVHGLSDALGWKPSRLSFVAFCWGLLGAASILTFQYWASATDWPINVGGKPFDSLPAFVPATFEMMVLFTGYGTAMVLFAVCGLAFGRQPRRHFPRATDDRFVLLVQQDSARFTSNHLRETFGAFHPEVIEEVPA